MKRKERLLGQITEVELRLGICATPARLAGGGDEAAGGVSTPQRQLPPLSPLSPPRVGGGKLAMNEVEMLKQVSLRTSCCRVSLRASASILPYERYSSGHRALLGLWHHRFALVQICISVPMNRSDPVTRAQRSV